MTARHALALASLGVLAAGTAACASLRGEFTCTASAACVDSGRQGVCEPTGFCSFPDATCTGSGRRYGDLAGGGLGGTCVVEAADGGLTNLLANPGCETSTDGWDGYQADLTRSTDAHGGAYSCEVCVQPGYTDFTFDDTDRGGASVVMSPHVGQVYRASAWVRAAAGVAAGQSVVITLREWSGPGNPDSDRDISDPLSLTQEWQYLEVTHTIAADSYAMDVTIANNDARDGDCFLVDDVAVYRLQ